VLETLGFGTARAALLEAYRNLADLLGRTVRGVVVRGTESAAVGVGGGVEQHEV